MSAQVLHAGLFERVRFFFKMFFMGFFRMFFIRGVKCGLLEAWVPAGHK